MKSNLSHFNCLPVSFKNSSTLIPGLTELLEMFSWCVFEVCIEFCVCVHACSSSSACSMMNQSLMRMLSGEYCHQSLLCLLSMFQSLLVNFLLLLIKASIPSVF